MKPIFYLSILLFFLASCSSNEQSNGAEDTTDAALGKLEHGFTLGLPLKQGIIYQVQPFVHRYIIQLISK